jgi:hypothetical protein
MPACVRAAMRALKVLAIDGAGVFAVHVTRE